VEPHTTLASTKRHAKTPNGPNPALCDNFKPPSTPISMDEERKIQDFKQQCLDYLNNVLQKITAFGDETYLLDDEHLAALNVRKAEPLDVEEKAIDFGHRFFSPRFSLEQARQKTTDFLAGIPDGYSDVDWPERCRRGSWISIFDDPDLTYDPEGRHPLCDPESCASFRQDWMLTATGACHDHVDGGVWEDSDWYWLEFVATPPPPKSQNVRGTDSPTAK
jgi:hypothetical protein